MNGADRAKKLKRVLLTDCELRSNIQTYLVENFFFRKLEIDQWMGGGVRYSEINEYNKIELASGKNVEVLMEDGFFESWNTFTTKSVNYLCGEFMWHNLLNLGTGKKKLIKAIITELVEKSTLTEVIKSEPILENLIKTGRQKVTGVKPYRFLSNQRNVVDLESGQSCFICTDRSGPFIASPAFILKKFDNAYRIMLFTHIKNYSETKDLSINQIIFLTVQSNELGLTPEVAVLQKW